MMRVQIPASYESERRYILYVMLSEFLGLEYRVQAYNGLDVKITAGDEKELLIADSLFAVPKEHWLKPASMPKQPLKVWNLAATPLNSTTLDPLLPVIFGEDPDASGFFIFSENKIRLGLDIFGSAFFMMTRYEEIARPESDHRDRFPATASLAHQEGFLDRPIVNECLEILWSCLQHLWPVLQRKQRHFRIYVSHDVDEPFALATSGLLRLAKHCGRDILIHHAPLLSVKNALRWLKIKKGDITADPYNTFDLIMDISEKHNLKSTFHFIADRIAGRIDGSCNIDHPLIRSLLLKVHHRGHEIGLHASYNSFRDAAQTKKEFERLKEVCASEGIKQSIWGSRQHYLRWETPTTLQNLADAGLSYDTTLSFTKILGFRCGVCYEFPAFNVLTHRQLDIRERPLVVMESTVFNNPDMNFAHHKDEIALQTILEYKKRCRLFRGDFTLLWHNNRFTEAGQVAMYEQVLS